jgi:hypothetical protein
MTVPNSAYVLTVLPQHYVLGYHFVLLYVSKGIILLAF